MKKILIATVAIALFIAMPVLTSCTDNIDTPVDSGTNPDDLKPYTVKQLPVNRDGQSASTVSSEDYIYEFVSIHIGHPRPISDSRQLRELTTNAVIQSQSEVNV